MVPISGSNNNARKIVSFDWAIKNLLRDKANFDVLEGFLSALMKRYVIIDSILESESNQTEAELKSNRVDVLAKLDGGELVIIEVQYESEVGFIKRLLYGTSKAIVENLQLGEPYDQVKKVYSVSIVHFNIGEGDDYVYSGRTEFTGIHTKHILKLKDRLTVGKIGGEIPGTVSGYDVFPEYYLIPLSYFHDLVNDDLDEWVYAIKNAEVLESFHSDKIDSLRDKLDILKMSHDKRRSHDKFLENRGSDKGTIEDAKAKGEMIGIEKGEMIGIEKGEMIGIKKGEKNKAVATAQKMKQKSMDSHLIAELTGLPIDEIEKL